MTPKNDLWRADPLRGTEDPEEPIATGGAALWLVIALAGAVMFALVLAYLEYGL